MRIAPIGTISYKIFQKLLINFLYYEEKKTEYEF